MKKVYSLLILAFLLTNQLYADNTKQELLKQANKGNIQAMLELNKEYNFPETKEGLAYYKRWYKTIDEKDEAKDIFTFSQVFNEYKDMFINGNLKYEYLLKLAKNKNYKKAFLPLFKFYINNHMDIEELELKNKILKNPTKEDLKEIYTTYFALSSTKASPTLRYKTKKIKEIMLKKGFLDKAIEVSDKLYKKDLSKEEKTKLLEMVYDSNDFETISKIADHLYDYKDKEAIIFYTKALKLAKKNSAKSDIYSKLALIYKYANYFKIEKDINKAISHLKKAIALGDKKAYIDLLNLYSRNKEYKNEHTKLKNELMKTNEGKKTYATYLEKGYEKKEANKIWEELANAQDENAIIKQAFNKKSYSYGNKRDNVSEQTKKWQTYILNSDNKSLKQKAKETIFKKGSNLVLIPGFIDNLFKKELKEKNIITLRKIAKLYDSKQNYEQSIKYLILAYNYGDVKSGIELARKYIHIKIKKTSEGIKILEALSDKKDIEATRELASLYYYTTYKQEKLKDINKGIKYFEKASFLGDIISTKDLYDFYWESKDFKNAKIYAQKLVDLKMDGYLYLGRFPLFGLTEKKDLQKAKVYFEKSAILYNPKAFYELGLLYFEKNKNKIDTDNKKTLEYFDMGNKLEDHKSILTLGTIYSKGYAGVKKDLPRAITYYKKIAFLNPKVAYYVAHYYSDRKDYKNAFKYFEKSLDRKTGQGYFELAILYEKGLGVKQSILNAFINYDKAYSLTGNPQAAYNIANLFHYGATKDLKEAKLWYKKANTPEAKKELQKIENEK